MSLENLYFLVGNGDSIGVRNITHRFNMGGLGSGNQSITNVTTTMLPSINNGCDISKSGSIENVSYVIFMVVILLASLLGNSLVVVATVLSKQLRNRVTVYFIVSLACSDFAFAALLIPFNISMRLYGQFCHSLGACYWMILSDAFINVASILNLFLIAIDRFIAIRLPFRYSFILSTSRAKKLIAGVWILSAIWSVTGIFKWDHRDREPGMMSIRLTSYCTNTNYYYYAASYFGIYLLPLAIMTFTYLMILHVAISHIRAIESTHVELSERDTPMTPVEVLSRDRQLTSEIERHQRARQQQRKRKKELKATKSVAIVYFAFLLCWFPNCVINIMIMFDPSHFPDLRKANETLFYFIYYCFIQILPMVNTMLNPIIYSFSNKQFRKGFKSVYNKLTGSFNSFDSAYEARNTRGASFAGTMSPASTTSSSTSPQSLVKDGRYRWSPTHIKKTSCDNANNIDGYHNANFNSDTLNQSMSNIAIWKPD